MGRPQKEKNNYEKHFKQLYEEKRIDGNAGLLRKMYTVYYKGKPDINTDRQTWVNSQEADFGKKIRGERAFTESDIKSIERAVGMSWVDIVEPLPEKPEMTKKFEEKGLRYAAYMDEERYYQDLADYYDADDFNNVALCNYDEYGKTIVDYIIENKAENARPEDVPEHTIFIITTDGMENASRRYSARVIKEKIKRQTEKYGWEFIFLAANIDAVETADNLGIRRDRAANYRQTNRGVERSYYAMSEAISSVRKGCAEKMDLAEYLKEDEEND